LDHDDPNTSEQYWVIHDLLKGSGGSSVPNPYLNQSPSHFWKTGVAALESRLVMPMPAKRFVIDNGATIATAGSCFAQEVGRYLATTPGILLLREEATGPDQPLFSALYGNVYTVRQLVQLFDRAFGRLIPVDTAWRRADGRFVDPFRPYVFRAGFAAVDEVASARAAHLGAVRRVFTNSSIFVFTLGLTESWRAMADGAVFPVAPGVVSDEIDPTGYEFHNFTYAEVLADLRNFISRLHSINTEVRVILTVSPVPLTATYTSEHVLVATAHSKAILRAVCSEVTAEFDGVYYFPSYEIISGNFNQGGYYHENLRTVTQAGVDHVMTLFRQTYFSTEPSEHLVAKPELAPPLESSEDSAVCDEQEIVRSVGFD
jgi:GSCFA family